jgi:SAM-dependent methyltransferase
VTDPSELFPEVPNLYQFPSVHNDMIYDEHRVEAYRRAIDEVVRPGDVVLDIGTGTGILSFLCLRAGAKRVHAVDRSPVIKWAQKIAETNGFDKDMVFHCCDSRDLILGEKVDVIVSELIGHLVFEEGMVESVSDAIDRFLVSQGRILPQAVTLYAAPVFEREVYRFSIDSWRPAYGIDYSVMREAAVSNTYVADISERDLFAKHEPVFSVDFQRQVPVEIFAERKFEIHRDGEINGLAFWFDSRLSDFVRLSSGPWAKTHWRQCFTPLPSPTRVFAGQQIDVSFSMTLCQLKSDRFAFNININGEIVSNAA